MPEIKSPFAKRFRGFLPVVVDIETGGFNPQTDAILEIAAVMLEMNSRGKLQVGQTLNYNVEPFPEANIEQSALEVTGIDPNNPLRGATTEKIALQNIFNEVRQVVKAHQCKRAILVGHNASFDLNFLHAAIQRTQTKRNPFHAFSNFDTVSLAGMAYGQTVLARACEEATIDWDNTQAHSAVYDAQKTAELFCRIINAWDDAHPQRRLVLFSH